MPITLHKAKRADNLTTVEALLDMAKAKMLSKLDAKGLTLKAWVCARREEWLLPGEPLSAISLTHLFPLASKFAGPPVNKATYATAQRALLADHDILMEQLRHIEPTEQELQAWQEMDATAWLQTQQTKR